MKPRFAAVPRLTLLLVALVAAIALLAFTQWRRHGARQVLPANATLAQRAAFYIRRIAVDHADVTAYVELGKLEEQQGYYTSALRRLYTARALGAPEKETLLPIGRSLARLARWDDAETELEKAAALMPDSAEASANLAGVYYLAGANARASSVLQGFVRRHRGADGTLRLSVADMHRILLCFSDARDTASARQLAIDILKVSPRDDGALAIAGHSLLAAGKYRDALPYLEAASRIRPDVSALCYNYGFALARCGRENEALTQLKRCVTLSPAAADAYLEMAAIYEKRRNWLPAAIAASYACRQMDDDLKLLYRTGKLYERAGHTESADYWYARTALSANRYKEALGYTQKLVHSSVRSWRRAGLEQSALAYRGLHDIPKYVALMEEACSGHTANDYLALADTYQQADLLDKNIDCLRRAAELDPGQAPNCHYQIANTLIKRGQRDGAEKELERAVAGDPDNPEYHRLLGSVYYERRTTGDRMQRAITELKEALRLDPGDAARCQDLGLAYYSARDYSRAAFCLEHAIDLDPGDGTTYQELGRVYALLGDKEAAEKMLSLYRRYVRFDESKIELKARADQHREDPRAQIALADLLARSGDLTGALDRYQRALSLRPNDPATRRKRDWVVAVLSGPTPAGATGP